MQVGDEHPDCRLFSVRKHLPCKNDTRLQIKKVICKQL